MYRLLTICLLLLTGISRMYGQAAKSKTTASDDRSLLWKISGNGLARPSYIFGTIHIICPSDYVWTPAMQKAFDATETVAFEMDMDDPGLQAKMTSGMMLPQGKKLRDFYSEADYKKLGELAAAHGIPLPMMQGFNPFALVSFLYLKAISCPVPESYEGKITGLAQEKGKDIAGLESVEEQMKVIGDMNADSIAVSVLRIAEGLDSFKATMRQMVDIYKAQDLPELYKLIIQSPDYKDDLNALLYNRNRKWAPVIEAMAKEEPVFFAVGAGHLWDGQGVIELLRARGYTVTPVR